MINLQFQVGSEGMISFWLLVIANNSELHDAHSIYSLYRFFEIPIYHLEMLMVFMFDVFAA